MGILCTGVMNSDDPKMAVLAHSASSKEKPGVRHSPLIDVVAEIGCSDLEFVKKFTRPNFWAKEFYTLKTSRLFLPAINGKNASLSVIWPSFGC